MWGELVLLGGWRLGRGDLVLEEGEDGRRGEVAGALARSNTQKEAGIFGGEGGPF